MGGPTITIFLHRFSCPAHHPRLRDLSCGISAHRSQPRPPSVPRFLPPDYLAMSSRSICLLPACPLPHLHPAHCPSWHRSWQWLLFTHQVLTPKSTSGLKFPGSEDQGQQRFQVSRTRLFAPLPPSPTRLRTGGHRTSGEKRAEGGAGWEDTAH